MYRQELIVRTKLTPPRPPRFTLARPRLTQRLLDALEHRLTIVQAGTGYGKTTALAALAEGDLPFVWYRLDAEDSDPQLFLTYLVHGFTALLPGLSHRPAALLEEWSARRSVEWTAVIDALIDEIARELQTPTLLILDDVHLINDVVEPMRMLDRFIGRAPRHLHTLLSTRYPLQLPTLLTWRVKGDLLLVNQEELAFTPAEIDALFRQRYGYALALEQATMLINRIEGWPIALHLIWQQLQRDGGASLPQALSRLSGSAGDLFAYLTQEVLAQQPADIRAFLQETAVLRQMTAESCDAIRQAHDSAEILRYLLEKGLFVVNLGDGQIRYHHLFRDLLRGGLPAAQADAIHRRAADYYAAHGEPEEAIHHLLQARDHRRAADILQQVGREMVRLGRLDTLSGWIGALAPKVLADYPALLVYLGDIDRLHSRFDQALNWYQQAELRSRLRGDTPGLGQALRGQARVYLDTVQTSRAEELLQQALRLSDGQEDRVSRARLLELLAENMLNQGRVEEATTYQAQARELREMGSDEAHLPVRTRLRTGRLAEARRILEEQFAREREMPVQRPRAHRETALLLSLVYALMGEQAAALETAVAGTERGRALDSHFTTSVGYSRQGHALLLLKSKEGYEQAEQCFRQAIALSRMIDVTRLLVEPYWGLCQIYGFQGDLLQAQQAASRGIEIVQADGDEWVESCLRVTMGAAFALAGEHAPAAAWLAQAQSGFSACSDVFGETAARLWQCYLWLQRDDEARLRRDLHDLLQMVQTHQYDFLFTRRTLHGPPDPRMMVPLLIFAREQELNLVVAERLLAQLELSHVSIHPGYQLRVQTLGAFRLWHGAQEAPARAWQRKKARQLFQLLLTHRDTLLHRDQITAWLWPELDEEGAVRDFKIAYSAMCNVLEPSRKRNAPSAFVTRDGSRYGLRTDADMWLDVAAFETAVDAGDRLYPAQLARATAHYRQAFDLYQGDFLQAYPYEEWCNDERDRLQSRYLQTAERLAEGLCAQQQWEAALPVCRAILEIDNCWETAYQMLMQAYHHLGQRTQAIRTYQRCAEALQKGLGVGPAAATQQLYEKVL